MNKSFIIGLSLAVILGISIPIRLQAADAVSANGFNCMNYEDGRVMCSGKFPFNSEITLSSVGRDSVAIIAEYQGKAYSYTSRNGCLCVNTPEPTTKRDQYECTSKKGQKRSFSPKERIIDYQTWCEMN